MKHCALCGVIQGWGHKVINEIALKVKVTGKMKFVD